MDRLGPNDLQLGDTVIRSRKGATFTVSDISSVIESAANGQPYRQIKIANTKNGATLDTTTDRVYKLEP